MTGSPDHSRERFRLARLAVAAGAMERALGAVFGAARVALLAWGLSTRDYGLYVAVLGIVATTGLLDFGLSFGLLNAVAKARGRDDDAEVSAIVSTAFLIYSLIAAVALLLFVPFALAAPMRQLLHVDPDQVGLARAIAAIGFGEALLVMPLRVFPSTFTGRQEQHVGSLFRVATGFAQFVAMAVALFVWRGKLLPAVALPAAVDLATALIFAGWARRRRVVVVLRAAKREYVRPLFGSGLVFFVSNVANLLRRSFPAIIISNALGPGAVPAFSVPFAMFTIGLSVSELIAGSLWPAYGEAAARGDWPWIRRAFRIGTSAAMLAATGIALLGASGGAEVMSIWAPKIAVPPREVFAILAVWLVTQASSSTAGTLLSGLNRNWLYMWSNLFEGVATLGLGLWFVRTSGITGVAAAMVIGGVVSALALNVYVTPRATDRNVRIDGMEYGKLLLSAVPAAVVGLALRSTGRTWPAFARMLTVATGVGLVYTLAAWMLVLTPSARERVLQRVRRARLP